MASGVISAPSRLYVHFLVIGRLRSIWDLTDDYVLRALGTTIEEMRAPWVMQQMRGREAAT
jgi:hypothetical protein